MGRGAAQNYARHGGSGSLCGLTILIVCIISPIYYVNTKREADKWPETTCKVVGYDCCSTAGTMFYGAWNVTFPRVDPDPGVGSTGAAIMYMSGDQGGRPSAAEASTWLQSTRPLDSTFACRYNLAKAQGGVFCESVTVNGYTNNRGALDDCITMPGNVQSPTPWLITLIVFWSLFGLSCLITIILVIVLVACAK